MQMENRKLEMQAKVFRVFSDPKRLKILERLKEGECNVSGLCRHLKMKQPTVSQHLRLLKDCGAVVTEKSGREVTYGIKDKKVLEMLELSDELLVLMAEDLMKCVCR